jgi:CheY-like chemotaxis protein/YHS domain-containing protein
MRIEPNRRDRLEGRKVDAQMNSGAMQVLIVDDDQDIRRALHDLLESQHYMVKSVGTGVQALEQVRDQRFGVVILDLELPDVNGLEVLRRLKEGDPTLPIIMLTATSNDADKTAALQYGARAFFTKPYSGHALISVVSAAIRRPEGSWPGPDLVREEATMNLEASAKTIDPVCGMEVIPFQSAGKSEHEGPTYYFCTPACKQLFEQNPRRYPLTRDDFHGK